MEPNFLDKARDSTLVENTAQAVFKHLDRLEDHRTVFGGRWVWELLQNARDAAPPEGVFVEIELAGDKLRFRHDGVPFKPKEIAHLIYHGSTKVGSDGDLDHFGSGFLSTHLLSRVVHVRGALADDSGFEFDLNRSGLTIDDLHSAMQRSWREFRESVSANGHEGPGPTEYVYALGPETLDFAREGLERLRGIGHLVLAFSPELRGIEIRTDAGSWRFARGHREYVTDTIEMLRVECLVDDVVTLRHMAIATALDDVQVVLPLSDMGSGLSVDLDKDTPRLFVMFPLVTTERLPFPAVVNSKRFKPREDRDGIVLDGNTERIAENKDLLETAAGLMVQLLAHGAAEKWGKLEQLVAYDSAYLPDWVDRAWFSDYLRKLIFETRQLPLLTTQEGRWVPPAESWIPYHEETECRKDLWNLIMASADGTAHLPQREHLERWFRNLYSWGKLVEKEELRETFTLRRLADLTDAAATVDGLTNALVSGAEVLAWLRQLVALIHNAGCTAFLDQLRILPSQAGVLRRRSELRYDAGVGDQLKVIAREFGIELRDELLDADAATPEVVELLTPKSQEEALDEVLEALAGSCADDTLPVDLGQSNVSLFWWLATSAHRQRLDGYPLITTEGTDGRARTVSLKRDRERAPLAPSSIWPTSESEFASLFPRRKVLHDLVAAPGLGATPDAWREFDADGFVRAAPLFRTKRPLNRFLVEEGIRDRDRDREDESHRSISDVEVSDIAFLNEEDIGLIDTARRSKPRAFQLIRFVVTSVMREDTRAFEELPVQCECGQTHSAFSAAWLIPLHDRKWIPTERGRSALVSAESLANLLAGQQDLVELLGGDDGTRFLRALEISSADFQLRAVATEEGDRLRLVRSMGELARAARGDIQRVEMLTSAVRDHPEIFDDIQEAKVRREKVQSNQRLGQLVEDLLAEELTAHSLHVRRTGVGSDFEVESDFTEDDEEVWLEIIGNQTSVLVEVKSTRSDRVRMTPTQASMANREQSRFALCVVSVLDDPPTRELVREGSRFVFEIGRMLAQPLRAYSSVTDATEGARRPTGDIDVEIAEGQVRFAVSQQVWLGGLRLDAAVARIARRA
jgi:Domain of unknown function (DUF3883)